MSKTIPLTQGFHAIVDDADYEELAQHRWHVYRAEGRPKYATRCYKMADGKKTTVKMHREIMGMTNPRQQVDHINGNGLDNRRDNLRAATTSQNAMNQAPHDGREYKGVSLHKNDGLYHARIMFEQRNHFIGAYDCARDAALAYNGAARALFGDYARLNDTSFDPKKCCGNCLHFAAEEFQYCAHPETLTTHDGDDPYYISAPDKCDFTPTRWTERGES